MSDAVIINPQGRFQRVPGHVDKPDDLTASASLIVLVKGAGASLERAYPRWRWMLRADEYGGIIDIMSELIAADFAYTLHIPKIDPTYQRVVRAGGELLERFGFSRGPYSHDEWRRAQLKHGQLIPDVSDLDRHAQRAARTRMIREGVANGSIRLATGDSIGAALQARKEGRL